MIWVVASASCLGSRWHRISWFAVNRDPVQPSSPQAGEPVLSSSFPLCSDLLNLERVVFLSEREGHESHCLLTSSISSPGHATVGPWAGTRVGRECWLV